MASQRRAPTKRPPRPAAKKPPPPNMPEGADGAESKTGKKAATKAAAEFNKSAAAGVATGAPASGRATKSAPAPSSSPSSAKATATTTPAPTRPRTSPSGPNYRPPTGAPRSSARRPPPPPRRKKKNWLDKRTIGAVVALALVCSLVIFFALAVNSSSTNPTLNNALAGPEQVPVPKGAVLAAVDSAHYPQPIDGIKCEANEQLVYHIHAHVEIFVNGQQRQVPYGIGMTPPLQYSTSNRAGTYVNGGTCFYWMHTHAADGIIHVESPTQTTYTLGQFFDMWGQTLKAGQVGPAVGPLTAWVNGKKYTGDVRAIPLTAKAQIQLAVGSPAPTQTTITFPSSM